MCESSVSMEMYPDEPDPPSIGKGAAGVKGPSTPKGAPSSKMDETTPSENGDQLESVKEAETVDAFVSIKKYIVPALKGLSPKGQVEVDEALTQPHTKQGIHTYKHTLLLLLFMLSSLFGVCACFQVMCLLCINYAVSLCQVW